MPEGREQVDARRQRCSDALLRPGRHDVGFPSPVYVDDRICDQLIALARSTVSRWTAERWVEPSRHARRFKALAVLRAFIKPHGRTRPLSKSQLIRRAVEAMLYFSDVERRA